MTLLCRWPVALNLGLMSFACVAILTTVLGLAGCSRPAVDDVVEFDDLHPVSGTASYDGTPLGGASIRLYPTAKSTEGESETFTGVVADDGSFEIFTYRSAGRGEGAPAGEYRISLSWAGTKEMQADFSRDNLPEMLPRIYTRPTTSGLMAKVEPGGTQLDPIELKKLKK
jgi:hypothetical protein